MSNFHPGLVHTPVTPFSDQNKIDFDLYARILDFHLANGADSLALPMHVGESVSLTDAERLEIVAFAVRHVDGRSPIIAHISQSGTAIAAALAKEAQEAGAAAIVTTTPYYWTPAPAMMAEHFAEIGGGVSIPFYIWNAPSDMGTKISVELVFNVLERVPNFVGVVDSSLDWQFMIDLVARVRRAHPNFQLLSGTEYLISAYAIGARGAFSPLAGIAPKAVRDLYDLCAQERYAEALSLQEEMSSLWQAVKTGGVAGVKAASRIMERDCRDPRSPILPVGREHAERLGAEMERVSFIAGEPRGWAA